MTEPNYFYRFCCNVPTWFTGGEVLDFKTICPCPTAEPVYKSTSTKKNISGIANPNDNRFYSTRTTTGYGAAMSEFWQQYISLNIDESLQRIETAICDNDTPAIINSYEGSATATASDVVECEVSYTAPDGTQFYEKSVINVNASANWEGGITFCLPNNTIEVDNWSYAENCDVADDWDFDFKFTRCINVTEDNITQVYGGGCLTLCTIPNTDPVEGTAQISFVPCGASTLGIDNTATETNVKYAYIFKNLRVDETYTAYLRRQYRDYLANYGVGEAPSAEANWSEDTPLQVSAFTADEIFKVVGGSLNVPSADFLDENYSTSIYSYPDTFYDPTTQEWDTDGEVITPTTNLTEQSGKQYRIKESYVVKTSPMECETEDGE